MASIYQLQPDQSWADAGAEFRFSTEMQARTPITADLNHDGTLDILFSDALTSPHVALSSGCNPNHWVEITAPEGSIITVEAGDFSRTALVTQDRSFSSAGPLVARVGLGSHDTITAITVQAPFQPPQRTEYPFATRTRHHWVGAP